MTVKALLSDLHAHKWSRFSTIGADGVSTRLRIILNEMDRASDELLAAGGKLMVLAGDLFHVRGSIEPSVYNPTHAQVQRILDKGIEIIAIPGNHDLEGKDTSIIGNAMQTFGALEGFTVCTTPTHFEKPGLFMVPWVSNVDQLLGILDSAAIDLGSDKQFVDVVIHAGIDGVLPGLPDHGLTAEKLQDFGFRRVFAGHYHNHKEVADGVISIGATTHQTFSDIGAKAGFLLFDENNYTYRASRAPSFVEINENTDFDDIPLIADGNYVRVSGLELDDSEVNQIRDALMTNGAKGVSFQVARKTASSRPAGTATAKGLTLDQSVSKFVESIKSPHEAKIKQRCDEILTKVRSITDEAA